MRAALLALLLAWMPAVAFAQSAPAPNAFQQVGVWAQQISAAQQPMGDSYGRCGPAIAAMTNYLGASPAERGDPAPILAQFKICMDDVKAASMATREALGKIGPMPRAIEQMLHIDSADILRRSAGAMDGMVRYLEQSDAAMLLAVGGDLTAAQAKFAEARVTAASVFDGQITLLEAIRASLPLQTHKRMIDIRLALSRSLRVITGSDPAARRGVLSAMLRGYGVDARTATAEMRSFWRSESADMRTTATASFDPALRRMIAILDTAIGEIAIAGDEVAATLEAVPAGEAAPAQILKTTDRLAQLELRMLAAIRAMSTAAAQ